MIHIPLLGTLTRDWQNRNNCDCVENPVGLCCSLNVKRFSLVHLDTSFPEVALFGKAVETQWGGSLKEVGAEGGP